MAKKIPPRNILIGILLALCFAVALFFRVYFPYDVVFGGEVIKFTGVDAYYHMRLVDNLAHSFPSVTEINPYFIYPTAVGETTISFFQWLLAGIIWVAGLGSPSQHLVDVIAVYYPAVLAALTVIPVYFIGRELFNRWAGIIAAGLIAIMPGEFIGRSILGFTDHHIAETLLTTTAVLFLILAIKTAQQKELTLEHLKNGDWSIIKKPLLYSLLAGFFLGLYLLTWQGALLFVLIFSAYFVLQSIIDQLKHRSTDYLCLIGVATIAMALIVFIPAQPRAFYVVSVVIALLIPLILYGISRLVSIRDIRSGYYPVILAAIGMAGVGILYLINPSLTSSMFSALGSLIPRGASLTTIEMQPLLFPSNQFTLSIAQGNFTTGFYLSFICLGVLVYEAIRRSDPSKNLFLFWSLVMMVLTLFLQRRFAYYYAINVALLTGYVMCYILSKTFFRESAATGVSRSRGRTARTRQRTGGFRITADHVTTAIIIVVVIVIVFPWGIGSAIDTASRAQFAPNDAWVSSLLWLKDNSPEPLGDADAYYQLYDSPPPGESFQYPESVYGVMAWWDYGYWITRIGRRIPNANPSQNPAALTGVANYFIAQDEVTANEGLEEFDSSYVIIDYDTAVTKYYAIALWSGSDTEFIGNYWGMSQEGLVQYQLYHPEYYQSLCCRLYNFNGQSVNATQPIVISYEEITDATGVTYRQITGGEEFNTYEEAQDYIASQETGNHVLVGTNPFISPVPLEPLEHYQLVYSSPQKYYVTENITVPAVKIFEYIE